VNEDVLIAVDPHKASNIAAVLDPVTKTVIEAARFANTTDGYAQLTAFTSRWGQRRWAVEGCFGAGRSLAQRLDADGEMVLDVPAKLAARVQVYSRGHGRKTDKDDAVSVGPSGPATANRCSPPPKPTWARSPPPARGPGSRCAAPARSPCAPTGS
jgi:hypothetical protein